MFQIAVVVKSARILQCRINDCKTVGSDCFYGDDVLSCDTRKAETNVFILQTTNKFSIFQHLRKVNDVGETLAYRLFLKP